MLILYAILTCFMIAVCLSDISRFLIPNWIVLAILALYPVAVWLSPARPDWKMACLIALITFIAGYILFFLRIMGGGDIKLLTATILYAGKSGFLDFLIYVAILGGLGTLLLLALRAMAPYIFLKLGKSGSTIPRVLTNKEPAPYGVAIAAAFLLMLWGGKLPGLIL
jgi:prepilin peptidase CpaA